MIRAALLSVLLLAACSTTTPGLVQRAGGGDAPFAFNGRIVILQDDGRRDSAGVRWVHRAGGDEILLLTPLGQTAARVTANDHRVMLEADGEQIAAQDAETLTQQVLGWSLPLSGLRYWVVALPAPDTAYEETAGENGQISVLRQQGWTLHYLRYAGTAADALPLRLDLRREGMEVRLAIDEWETP